MQRLGAQPRMGRLIENLPEQHREWLIDFGDSGYVVRYLLDDNAVTILAFGSRRKAGL